MTAYNLTRTQTISPDVAERKAARKKVIERARELERESYKAFMRRKQALLVTALTKQMKQSYQQHIAQMLNEAKRNI